MSLGDNCSPSLNAPPTEAEEGLAQSLLEWLPALRFVKKVVIGYHVSRWLRIGEQEQWWERSYRPDMSLIVYCDVRSQPEVDEFQDELDEFQDELDEFQDELEGVEDDDEVQFLGEKRVSGELYVGGVLFGRMENDVIVLE